MALTAGPWRPQGHNVVSPIWVPAAPPSRHHRDHAVVVSAQRVEADWLRLLDSWG